MSHGFQPQYPREKVEFSSCAPEVVDPSTDKEVVTATDKEAVNEDGKQVAFGQNPEVVHEENLPEAKDSEGDKEVVSSDIEPEKQEKHNPILVQWRRDHKVTLLLVGGIILLVIVAVGLGAGLGVALNDKSSGSNSSSTQYAASTTLYDASVIPTPTTASLPLGTKALALSTPQAYPSSCLTQRDQQVAWDCNLVPNSQLALVLQQSVNTGGGLVAEIFYGSDHSGVQYGAQAPHMNTSLAQVLTVVDESEPSYGAAYYFQQSFDKVVVVPETAINTSGSSKKIRRRLSNREDERIQKRESALPGEKPWFCVFNATLLEAFIYIDKPALSINSASTSTPMSTTSLSPSSDVTITTTTATTSSTVSPTSTSNPWTTLTPLPLVAKLSERRLSKNPQTPYCQQYQILHNGEANWVADNNGNPVVVELKEEVSSNGAANSCACQWMSGVGP